MENLNMKKRNLLTFLMLSTVIVCFMSCSDKKKTEVGASNVISEKALKKIFASKPNPETDFDFQVNNDFTAVTITGYKGQSASVYIPTEIQGVPVTEIATSFNRTIKQITSLYIPDSVTKIGKEAFSDEKDYLSGRDVPLCYMESVRLPENLKVIDSRTFSCLTSLKTVIFPKNLERIERYAFYSCMSLESLTLPETVYYIGKCAFQDSGIEVLNLPSSLRVIEPNAFEKINAKNIVLPEGLLFLGENAFAKTQVQSVTFPASLKYIFKDVFGGCNFLSEIIVPEGFKPEYVAIKYNSSTRRGEDITLADVCTGREISQSIALQKLLRTTDILGVYVRLYHDQSYNDFVKNYNVDDYILWN